VGAPAVSRQVTLNAVQAGITRLRDKGGANPQSLYDLVNGYVTAARTMRVRPGTTLHANLPASTRGLAVYRGQLVTFSHQGEDMGAANGVRLEVIRHPTIPGLPLFEIHFAAPFMGFLYVVAEFSNGDTFHFWLQELRPWTAGAVIREGDTVSPTVPNGYLYEATRADQPAALWAPNVERAVDDVVEPTTANGYRYKVVEVTGPRPASGATEPAWIATNGAQVIESSDIPQTSTQPAEPTQPIAPDGGAGDALSGRYFDILRGAVRR